MTEYWVSQGNHWCSHCRVWLSNNAATIRMHESGTKHKLAVADKLRNLQKDAAAQDRERKEAQATIGRIEQMAQRKYEKDLAEQRRAEEKQQQKEQQEQEVKEEEEKERRRTECGAESRGEGIRVPAFPKSSPDSADWVFDSASGYFYNSSTGYYYDSTSGLYYCDAIGKWDTRENMLKAAAEDAGPPGALRVQALQKASVTPAAAVATPGQAAAAVGSSAAQAARKQMRTEMVPLLGPVRKKPAGTVPGNVGKGVESSVAGERKTGALPSGISKAEAAARAAREAARQRTEERDKKQRGLYSAYQ